MTELEFLNTLLQDRISMLIDNLVDMFNTDEPYLYQQGVFDGIQIMKLIDKI
ncbi:hypothetical protein LJC58_09950 [Lachnospiraceae bacterium OttesenSCG-928-D06]|nr:hypothetical protein [Lachnospiraceae bacterium OttesenSCG-928-D06]